MGRLTSGCVSKGFAYDFIDENLSKLRETLELVRPYDEDAVRVSILRTSHPRNQALTNLSQESVTGLPFVKYAARNTFQFVIYTD